MSREAMQQALEAMIEHGSPYLGHESAYQSAITALRATLAEPEQAPISLNNGRLTQYSDGSIGVGTPTPRKPLTYDELEPLCEAFDSYDTTQNELVEFARAIERAHGITGEQT